MHFANRRPNPSTYRTMFTSIIFEMILHLEQMLILPNLMPVDVAPQVGKIDILAFDAVSNEL
jgi:hypothetical protein